MGKILCMVMVLQISYITTEQERSEKCLPWRSVSKFQYMHPFTVHDRISVEFPVISARDTGLYFILNSFNYHWISI